MSEITFNGLGSGLDYSSWIDALVKVRQSKIDTVNKQVSNVEKKKTAMSEMQGYYSDLQNSVSSFTSAISSENIFNQKTVTSSNRAISASVTSNANAQNLSVSVSQLATSTVAQSSFTAAKAISTSSTMNDISNGAFSDGSFSIYVNGSRHSVNVSGSDSLQSVLDSFNSITGVSASLSDEGKLSIESTDSSSYRVSIGSSADSSNFLNVMSLSQNAETGAYTSSKSVFSTDTSSALTSAAFAKGNVTEGTFKIGTEEFTIDSNTTLDSLIADINKSDAGVEAYWNSASGKLVLTSKDQGAININIEAGTSNFTDIMGLTESEWDENGALTSTRLADDSQTLGTNAVLQINGTTITAASNTITGDISGITGLTMTLNSVTDENVSVNVAQDVDSVAEQLQTFVDAYNKIISATNEATSRETGTLYGENVLNSLKTSIRRLATASNGATEGYNLLSQIGISTAKYSNDTTIDTDSLSIDTSKLKEALQSNPDAVKELLTGANGIFTKINASVKSALDPASGYFHNREASYDKEISNYNKKISKMETNLESYKTSLEAKFQAMDELISNLQNQSAVFDSYFNNKNKDDK